MLKKSYNNYYKKDDNYYKDSNFYLYNNLNKLYYFSDMSINIISSKNKNNRIISTSNSDLDYSISTYNNLLE
jgi:hypothetical protein